MAEKDVVLAKVAIVRNCLASIQKATGLAPSAVDDQFKQDVFVLNLERAIQACIDMANALIAERGWMMPASYKQAFQILGTNGAISNETTVRMGKMAGFRNIAVHDYQQLNPAILKSIINSRLPDLEAFCKEVLQFLG